MSFRIKRVKPRKFRAENGEGEKLLNCRRPAASGSGMRVNLEVDTCGEEGDFQLSDKQSRKRSNGPLSNCSGRQSRAISRYEETAKKSNGRWRGKSQHKKMQGIRRGVVGEGEEVNGSTFPLTSSAKQELKLALAGTLEGKEKNRNVVSPPPATPPTNTKYESHAGGVSILDSSHIINNKAEGKKGSRVEREVKKEEDEKAGTVGSNFGNPDEIFAPSTGQSDYYRLLPSPSPSPSPPGEQNDTRKTSTPILQESGSLANWSFPVDEPWDISAESAEVESDLSQLFDENERAEHIANLEKIASSRSHGKGNFGALSKDMIEFIEQLNSLSVHQYHHLFNLKTEDEKWRFLNYLASKMQTAKESKEGKGANEEEGREERGKETSKKEDSISNDARNSTSSPSMPVLESPAPSPPPPQSPPSEPPLSPLSTASARPYSSKAQEKNYNEVPFDLDVHLPVFPLPTPPRRKSPPRSKSPPPKASSSSSSSSSSPSNAKPATQSTDTSNSPEHSPSPAPPAQSTPTPSPSPAGLQEGESGKAENGGGANVPPSSRTEDTGNSSSFEPPAADISVSSPSPNTGIRKKNKEMWSKQMDDLRETLTLIRQNRNMLKEQKIKNEKYLRPVVLQEMEEIPATISAENEKEEKRRNLKRSRTKSEGENATWEPPSKMRIEMRGMKRKQGSLKLRERRRKKTKGNTRRPGK